MVRTAENELQTCAEVAPHPVVQPAPQEEKPATDVMQSAPQDRPSIRRYLPRHQRGGPGMTSKIVDDLARNAGATPAVDRSKLVWDDGTKVGE